MAKDDELQSFRISDVRRPHVRGGRPPEERASIEQETSVGFSNIENLLETGSVEEVADTLRGSYGRLEALATSSDLRTRAAAQKAMVAYERVADLFEYLFETKAALGSENT